ncbi:MAG: metallophosphatase family protein [Candidatus Bathyarchaeota archaeon]|nr:metallophosphatase family protein [Candidatus Bathyarchaeota archaeon]MDW8040921.1 metallophosphoesterase family protein [Nitrososphaerota archaeon]
MLSQEAALKQVKDKGSAKIVGLISDTHVPVRAREIPQKVFEIFEKADYIIHAGDLVDLTVIDRLEQIAPVLAVYGNMDGPEIRGKLPKMNSVKVFDWKIGVMHDPGTMFGMGKMREIAKQNGFHVLVYGHTHHPNVRWEGEILFINPGSPTNPIPPFIAKPTVGLLTATKERISPEIIVLS